MRRDSEHGCQIHLHIKEHYITPQANAMHNPLKSLKFLVIDCQTTGNSPKYNNLLEIGWLTLDIRGASATDESEPTTFIIRQPPEFPLPGRIEKLTGIGKNHAEKAIGVHEAMEALLAAASNVAKENRMARCPVVIHYARFEMGFLSEIYRRAGHTSPLPFHVICTHQIASRLIPHLPRKGIRAVAGYLGHGAPYAKRCAPHLAATRHIWSHLIIRLAEQVDVHTLDELGHWLDHSPIPSTSKIYPMPREQRLNIPDSPGIYRMMRSDGSVLYIGKATSLKQRINSYFQKKRHTESTLEMLTQALKVDVTRSDTALEAALIESDAIKACHPPYNVALISRNRALSFVSRDFATHSDSAIESCPLGPVTTPAPFKAVHAIGAYLASSAKIPPNITEILDLPTEYIPNRETFLSGLELFRQKHQSGLCRLEIIPALMHIGRLSWHEKLVQRGSAGEPSTELTPNDTGDEKGWTPESVVSCVESICRRCGFMLRRSRWFSMLSESTVVWRAGGELQNRRNILTVQMGDVTYRDQIPVASPVPSPRRSKIPYVLRRANIDLVRHDRLRVLTTELRRLVSENRLEYVRLGEKSYLHPPQIRVLLDWI